MIIYHPANDINHCAFRFVTLLYDIAENQTEWERLQIMDFYYVFPHFLANIRLPRNPIVSKQALKAVDKPYESLPNPRRLMFQLKSLHSGATRALVAKGIIDKDYYLKNIMKLNKDRLPKNFLNQMNENQKRNTKWYRLLINFFDSYPLNGKDGLKSRTELLEYRYDTI